MKTATIIIACPAPWGGFVGYRCRVPRTFRIGQGLQTFDVDRSVRWAMALGGVA
jgi:hypothetical protein